MAQRVQITVDIEVPHGQTPRDAVEWISRYLSYFHQSMDPRVNTKTIVVTGQAPDLTPPPTADDLL